MAPPTLTAGPFAQAAPLHQDTGLSHPPRPGFDVGPGRPPIPARLVDQIKNGAYIEFSELLPDTLRDKEVPRQFLYENQNLIIPKRLAGR